MPAEPENFRVKWGFSFDLFWFVFGCIKTFETVHDINYFLLKLLQTIVNTHFVLDKILKEKIDLNVLVVFGRVFSMRERPLHIYLLLSRDSSRRCLLI